MFSFKTKYSTYAIWFVGSLFVLFQFFLQLSSGVIIGAIMRESHLTALTAGLLSSAFYLIYTFMQIPVGILFDHYNPRILLTINALICSVSCLIFATSHQLPGLFCGRILMGAGASFAFVGLTHLLRQHYPFHRFGFLIGLSETLGFFATVLGIIGLGSVINLWGWRNFINLAAFAGLFIALLCWHIIPGLNERKLLKNELIPPLLAYNSTSHTTRASFWVTTLHVLSTRVSYHSFYHRLSPKLYDLNQLLKTQRQDLKVILSSKKLWINGLFIGLSFALVTVFGALWAASFIQVKLSCSLRQASLINAMFFLGTGISCPLFGVLPIYFKRRPLIICSYMVTIAQLFILLYVPIKSLFTLGSLMFSIGLSCGGYILAYPIANELAPRRLLSTSAGFTNTLALITTPILQPFIGFLLDFFATTPGSYTIQDYQHALLVIPCAMIGASILVLFLPEKSDSIASD